MKAMCKECGSLCDVSIFDERVCCGIGSACIIQSYAFEEFLAAYQEIYSRITLTSDEKELLRASKFVIPLNGLFGDTSGLIDDLVAQLLLNNTVCIDSSQLIAEETDDYFRRLVKHDLVKLVNFDPLCLEPNFEQEIALVKERSEQLFNLLVNFEDMIRLSNYNKLAFEPIIPGWATV